MRSNESPGDLCHSRCIAEAHVTLTLFIEDGGFPGLYLHKESFVEVSITVLFLLFGYKLRFKYLNLYPLTKLVLHIA